MSLRESFELSLKTLGRNRLRSALTLLGIAIGVGAVLAMVAVGDGARSAIEEQVTAAGLNVITVTAGNYKMKVSDPGDVGADHASLWEDIDRVLPTRNRPSSIPTNSIDEVRLAMHPEDDPMEKHDHPTARQRLGDSAAGLGAAATLTAMDADAIRAGVAGVQHAAGAVHESARVVLDGRRWFTRLHGTEPSINRIRRSWAVSRGRFFTDREANREQQVVVLGSVVSEKLFGPDADPIGRTVSIWNQPFEVVGVVSSTSWTAAGAVGDDQFDAVYVPLATVHRLLNLTKLNTITITARSAGETSRVATDVTRLLRQRHGIGEDAPDDFVVGTQASAALGRGMSQQIARAVGGNVPGLEQVTLGELATTLDRSSRTMTALLGSVAAVSLLVGGIGIMNVMLLSVTERTREIGLRMAVGARGRDVHRQFLAEALTLSLVGGALGIATGLAAAGGVRRLLQWSAVVSPEAVILALGAAAAVGVVFGIYPARQAARLDPIDALRFE